MIKHSYQESRPATISLLSVFLSSTIGGLGFLVILQLSLSQVIVVVVVVESVWTDPGSENGEVFSIVVFVVVFVVVFGGGERGGGERGGGERGGGRGGGSLAPSLIAFGIAFDAILFISSLTFFRRDFFGISGSFLDVGDVDSDTSPLLFTSSLTWLDLLLPS